MTTEKRDSTSLFINIGLAVALITLVLVMARDIRSLGRKELAARPVVMAPATEAPPQAYALPREVPSASPEAPKSLSDVYSRYPASDVGENAVEKWKQISPEDKSKLAGLMDKTIENSKAALEANPNDKKAKKLLHISEILKRQIMSDYKVLLEPRNKAAAPEEEKR